MARRQEILYDAELINIAMILLRQLRRNKSCLRHAVLMPRTIKKQQELAPKDLLLQGGIIRDSYSYKMRVFGF